jgi:hypothetical protein
MHTLAPHTPAEVASLGKHANLTFASPFLVSHLCRQDLQLLAETRPALRYGPEEPLSRMAHPADAPAKFTY